MRSHFPTLTYAIALIYTPCIRALNLDVTDASSIKAAAQTVAQDLLGYYNGTQPGRIVGLFGDDSLDNSKVIYWWNSGAAWDSLLLYWDYTGDAQYNSLVQQALLFQTGPNNDYMPPNQTKTEGNDDQNFWALAAMTAAELQFPSPSTASNVTWIDLAKNVFDLQAARWDTQNCGGGLRWQIFSFNSGYEYENAISTGTFFQLAARLARYTGNSTYTDWANKSYDWIANSSLITSDFKVYDGAAVSDCNNPNKLQWTFNAADLVYGSAVMYNLTNGNAQWQNRTQSFLSAMSVFFSRDGVIKEVACEPQDTCNNDQYSFKGIAAEWLGATVQIAPFTADTITPYLQASAKGAAASCSGGDNKTACGFDWTKSKHDGKTGFGQELSALNVILANLATNASVPVTAATSPQNSTLSGSKSPSPSASTASTGTSASASVNPYSSSSRLLPLQTVASAMFLIVAVAFFMM